MELPAGPALRPLVLRSTASVGAIFAVLVMSLVQAGTERPASPAGERAGTTAVSTTSVWESAYSERYPGCVSMVLWPADEVPVALVTRSVAGTVARIPVEALERPPAALARARAIGACR